VAVTEEVTATTDEAADDINRSNLSL
jgi:hypothetical protein